jgi:hypothetical protein
MHAVYSFPPYKNVFLLVCLTYNIFKAVSVAFGKLIGIDLLTLLVSGEGAIVLHQKIKKDLTSS